MPENPSVVHICMSPKYMQPVSYPDSRGALSAWDGINCLPFLLSLAISVLDQSNQASLRRTRKKLLNSPKLLASVTDALLQRSKF